MEEKIIINSKKDNSDKKNLIKNTGCCGAVSEAWVPSYPSIPLSNNVSSNDNQSYSLFSHNNNFLQYFNSLTEREDK